MQAAIARTKHGLFRYLPNDKWCGRSLELYGEWSDAEAGLIEQLVAKGATVVEVGSHLGAHTVPLAKHVGPAGRVIAFEPQGMIYGLLCENLRTNGAAFVDARRMAVGARKGTVQLPVVDYDAPEGNFGGVSLLNAGPGGAKVRLVTIDSLKLDRLDLLKADVEGMEVDVIRGAEQTIKRLRPILYLENDREEKSPELIALLQDLGYRLWWHLPPLYHPKNFRNNGVNVFPGVVSVNMLCIPTERDAKIHHLREVRSPSDKFVDATRPHRAQRQAPADGQKRLAVLLPYAYGDALFSSSAFYHLKREGWHITAYCDGHGEEILRHDPNVDQIVWLAEDEVVLGDIGAWFAQEKKDYDRAFSLWETVVRNLLAWQADSRFQWPDALRRRIFGGNYLDLVHAVAEVPLELQQRFYPSAEERHWAISLRSMSDKPVAVLAASGSTVPKFWPYLEELADELLARGFEVWILGDLREQEFDHRTGLHVIGTQWTMRQACAWTQQADLVIGQETGLLNAVALEAMPKIVLLTHSTRENLTRDWENTVALHGDVPCWPCHRLHGGFETCTRDEKTGTAACQAAIAPAEVLEWVDAMAPTLRIAGAPGGFSVRRVVDVLDEHAREDARVAMG